MPRYGPGQQSRPFRVKPFRVKPHVPPTPHRSVALAQREGGIVHLRQEPREAGIGRQPSPRARAREMHQQARQLYAQGKHKEAVALNNRALALIGRQPSTDLTQRLLHGAGAAYMRAERRDPTSLLGTAREVGGELAASLNPVTAAR